MYIHACRHIHAQINGIHACMIMHAYLHPNPPAPKVPRRGSLAARDTDRSVRLVQLQLGGRVVFDRAGRQKVHRTLVICTFCRSAQNRPNAPFRSNMATTLARLGVNFGQQGPNLDQLALIFGQLGCKMAQFGPVWTHFGSTFGPS